MKTCMYFHPFVLLLCVIHNYELVTSFTSLQQQSNHHGNVRVRYSNNQQQQQQQHHHQQQQQQQQQCHQISSFSSSSSTMSSSTLSLTTTQLHGIDYDNIYADEECDFINNHDLSNNNNNNNNNNHNNADMSSKRCLPIPSAEIIAEEVVALCMEALTYNNEPIENAGLQVCFDFSSDRCRAGK